MSFIVGLLQVVGVVVIAVGVAMWSVPMMLIVVGALLVSAGVQVERQASKGA